jgi:hypothetical protein
VIARLYRTVCKRIGPSHFVVFPVVNESGAVLGSTDGDESPSCGADYDHTVPSVNAAFSRPLVTRYDLGLETGANCLSARGRVSWLSAYGFITHENVPAYA